MAALQIEEPNPDQPPPPEEGEPPAEPNAPLVFEINELAVLRLRIDNITEMTGAIPAVSQCDQV